jgi:DNA-damage-inducible protein J
MLFLRGICIRGLISFLNALKGGVLNPSTRINVTIRLEKDIKERAERMFSDLGMNLSTAFNVFTRQALRQGKIPFEIYDPFYSEENQMRLARSIADAEAGKVSVHDLIEVDDD